MYRGPQSTLAGRAALACAIYVKTKDPVFRFEVAARGMGGEDELSTGAGMVNVPLIEEQVALRVAGEYQRSESAFDDDRGDFNTPIFSEVRRTTVHSGGLDVVQEATSALLLTAQSGFSRSATERPSVNAGTAGETNILTGDRISSASRRTSARPTGTNGTSPASEK